MSAPNAELSGEWVFDPAHTRVGFSARHAMLTKVLGAFNDVEGRIHVDPAGLTESWVSVRMRAESVDTRQPQRDAHLRSADFFDAEHYPELVFTSTSIDEVEEGSYLITGDLTIRDVTRQLTVPVNMTGIERTPDGELRAGFQGSRRVDRRDWNLRWQRVLDSGGVLVSEKITLELEVSAVRVPDSPPPGGVDDAGTTGTQTATGAKPAIGGQPATGAHPATGTTGTVPAAGASTDQPTRARHRSRRPWWRALL